VRAATGPSRLATSVERQPSGRSRRRPGSGAWRRQLRTRANAADIASSDGLAWPPLLAARRTPVAKDNTGSAICAASGREPAVGCRLPCRFHHSLSEPSVRPHRSVCWRRAAA
jgi:hypothetical protein